MGCSKKVDEDKAQKAPDLCPNPVVHMVYSLPYLDPLTRTALIQKQLLKHDFWDFVCFFNAVWSRIWSC